MTVCLCVHVHVCVSVRVCVHVCVCAIQAVAKGCVVYRGVRYTGVCGIQGCAVYRGVWYTGVCGIQGCAVYRGVRYRGVWYTGVCSIWCVLVCAVQADGAQGGLCHGLVQGSQQLCQRPARKGQCLLLLTSLHVSLC